MIKLIIGGDAMIISSRINTPNIVVRYIDFTDLPITVCEFGWEKTSPNHTWSPNGRPRYLIHLIKNGKCTVERNGVITHLSRGDCFINHPDEPSVIKTDFAEPCEYYWIAFNGTHAKRILQETTKNLYPKFKESGLVAIDNLLKNENCDHIGSLNALFSVLNSIKDESKPETIDFVKKAIIYIENNYFEAFNVSKYAKQIGISRAHFTTIFTKRVGMAPYDYLIKTRIEASVRYLKENKLSISQIAYKVGFSSLDRFGKMFKKITGKSPKKYRSSNLSIT